MIRSRVTPSRLRTDGRFARYRRRREQIIQEAYFEGPTLGLAFSALALMVLIATWGAS